MVIAGCCGGAFCGDSNALRALTRAVAQLKVGDCCILNPSASLWGNWASLRVALMLSLSVRRGLVSKGLRRRKKGSRQGGERGASCGEQRGLDFVFICSQ